MVEGSNHGGTSVTARVRNQRGLGSREGHRGLPGLRGVREGFDGRSSGLRYVCCILECGKWALPGAPNGP